MSLTKIGSIGINTGIQLAGVTTVSTLHVGSGVTLSSDGDIFATGISTFSEDIKVGSGVTISPDGDGFYTGVVTATTFSGSLAASNLTGALPAISGANLTNLDASDLTSGTVPTARLGSGTASSSTFLRGDSTFAAVTSTTINNNANNRVITGSGTADTLEGESSFTYDGNGMVDIEGTGAAGIQIKTPNNTDGGVYYRTGSSNPGAVTYQHSDNSMRFRVNSTEKVRITSDGHFGIGDTTPAEILTIRDATPRIRLEDSDTTNAACQFVGDNASVLIQADTAGVVSDSTISFAIDGGEVSRFDSSGRLLIGTTTEGHPAADEFTIQNTASGADMGITLRSATNGQGAIYFSDGTTGDDEYRGIVNYNHSSDFFSFFTNASERYRMHSDGGHSWNNTTFPYSEMFHFYNGSDKSHMSIYQNSSGDYTALIMRHGRGGLSGYSGKAVSFRGNDGTEEGSIVIGTTATAFNTSSDYRLKENEVLISDGITRLKQLKPYRFNFKKDPSVTVDGFFAHEVTPVVPQAVSGDKDEVYTEENATDGFNAGDMRVQSLDYSKLTPLLTAALQEAIAEIESLKQRLDAAGL